MLIELKFWNNATNREQGSGCGSVGRAVASNTRGPRFESSHRQIFIYILKICILSTVCWIDENKEKEARNGPFKKNREQERERERFEQNCFAMWSPVLGSRCAAATVAVMAPVADIIVPCSMFFPWKISKRPPLLLLLSITSWRFKRAESAKSKILFKMLLLRAQTIAMLRPKSEFSKSQLTHWRLL